MDDRKVTKREAFIPLRGIDGIGTVISNLYLIADDHCTGSVHWVTSKYYYILKYN